MGQSADFDSLDSTIPKVGEHGEAPSILPSKGRLIQTHEPWRKEYRRAIYLVRDVRDIVLSDYAWDDSLDLTKHFDIATFDDYLLPWLKGRVQNMGNWQDHTQSWLASPLARNEDLLMIRYEDMRRHTEDALLQMVDFLGVSADRGVIQEVIANNSLENMRLKEDNSRKYDPNKLNRKSGEEHRFVRKGSVGGWRARLTDAQVQLIEQYTGHALARLGYPTANAPTAESVGSISSIVSGYARQV